MRAKLAARGFELDESSWLNPVDAIWSVHVRDRDCPMLFANGKGVATKYLTNHLGWFRVRDRSARFSPDPAQLLALAVRA
jgi:hypothetical protein